MTVTRLWQFHIRSTSRTATAASRCLRRTAATIGTMSVALADYPAWATPMKKPILVARKVKGKKGKRRAGNPRRPTTACAPPPIAAFSWPVDVGGRASPCFLDGPQMCAPSTLPRTREKTYVEFEVMDAAYVKKLQELIMDRAYCHYRDIE